MNGSPITKYNNNNNNNNNNSNFIVPIKGPPKRQRVTYKTNIDSMYI